MISAEDLNVIKDYLSNAILPIGTIIIFSTPTAPEGFLICDGSWVSKGKYPILYNIIGDIFGEDNGEMFRLPDLRGRFVRGYDNIGLIDPDHPFGECQDDAFQGHSHKTDWTELKTSENGEHSHIIIAEPFNRYSNGYGSMEYVHEVRDYNNSTNFSKSTNNNGKHNHTLPNIILGDVCSNRYGKVKVSTETRPKNISLIFCIKAK